MPSTFGVVSAMLLCANAAVNPGSRLGCLGAHPFSTTCSAAPLLSPLSNAFVLFMLVQWTANQLNKPLPLSTHSKAGHRQQSIGTAAYYSADLSDKTCGLRLTPEMHGPLPIVKQIHVILQQGCYAM